MKRLNREYLAWLAERDDLTTAQKIDILLNSDTIWDTPDGERPVRPGPEPEPNR